MLAPIILFVLLTHNALAAKDPILGADPKDSPQQMPSGLTFGDMELNDKQKEALKKGWNMGGMNKNSFAAVKGVNLRWTNAVIPYEIDCSIEHLDDAVQSVYAAMAEWEAKTCIRFVKRTTEKYFLKFFRDTHCWGNVGMTSYTKISVGYGCEYQNVMTHEIGHVVGFYHEQNRKDRDNYVTVHWENIGQFKDAFDIVKNTDSLGVAYDYESIMHYPWGAFSSNGKDTMSPKRALNGKRPYVALSQADADQTSRMYNCPAIEKKRAAARMKRASGEKEKRDIRECVDKSEYCPDWAKAGHCVAGSWMIENCKLSCGSPSCKASNCIDLHTSCPMWKKWGHCSKNTRVAMDCQKSCNPVCAGTTPTKAPTQPPKPTTDAPVTKPPTDRPTGAPRTQHPTSKPDGKFLGKGILCIDSDSRCAKWAKQGECERNPGWMLRGCMKSCKVKTCDPGVLKPPGACANPLGLAWDGTNNFKIPDSAFYSPSHLSPGGGWDADAKNARLYFQDDYTNKRIGAWCARSHDTAKSSNGYVQVDLGQSKTITHIATQGRHKYFERVGKFKIQYSNDGSNFQMYQENGEDKLFEGNCDHRTPVLNKFNNQISARYIRYLPWNWNYPCVRMELYGC